MRKGMEEVIPMTHFSLFQWYEIETLVCGNPDVDVEVLRKHTTYRAGLTASHPVSRNLFRALTSFSNEERRLFLRFVWGRNRLPLQHGDWVQPFAIGLASPPNGCMSASSTTARLCATLLFLSLPPFMHAMCV